MESTRTDGSSMADYNVFVASVREALEHFGATPEELAHFKPWTKEDHETSLASEIGEVTPEKDRKFLVEEAEIFQRDVEEVLAQCEESDKRSARFEAEGANFTEAELLEHEEACRAYEEYLQKRPARSESWTWKV